MRIPHSLAALFVFAVPAFAQEKVTYQDHGPPLDRKQLRQMP
jgi:hypothetical protein